MNGHQGPISGIASNETNYIATAGYDNQLILWHAARQSVLARTRHNHLVNQCAFSPCGNFLASASSDYTAKLWRLPDLELVTTFAGHADDVEMIAFHPTRKILATACRDDIVRVYKFNGDLLASLRGHGDDVNSVAWLGDSPELISSSDDGTLKRWNFESHTLEETIDMGGVQTDTVVVSSMGQIFAGNDEGEIITVNEGQQIRIPAHGAGIKRLVLNEGLRMLVSMSYDRSLRIWKIQDDGRLEFFHEASLPSQIWPRSAAFVNQTTLILATFGTSYASYDYSTSKWDLEKVHDTFGNNAVVAVANSVYRIGDAGILWKDNMAISQLGSLCNFLCPFADALLTGGQLGIVFDGLTGKKLYQHRSPLNCAATFMKDGSLHAIVGSYTGEGIIFKIEDAEIKFVQLLQLFDNAVKGVCASETEIFAVCATGAATWVSIPTLQNIRQNAQAHDRIANGCAALADGSMVSISRDLKLRIWTQGKAEVIESPHSHSIKCTSTSHDGRFIGTAAYNGRISIYDRKSQRWTADIRPTSSGISCLSFDGQNFLASSYDGAIYTVRPQSQRLEIVKEVAPSEARI